VIVAPGLAISAATVRAIFVGEVKKAPSSRELLLMSKKPSAAHPGEVLRQEFLVPMKLSPYARSPRSRRAAHPHRRLVNGQTALTADTALRLAKAFRTTPAFWMSLQAQYDIERAQDEIGSGLRKITPIVEPRKERNGMS
jgi:addiction module HigA family antidote